MKKLNEEIEIINDGELKQNWIEVLNSNVAKNEEVRESLSKSGKAYLVVAGESYIDKIYKTKRARGYVEKKKGESYYSEASMSMVNAGAGLKIIKITAEEFMETNDPQVFYNWLLKEYKTLRGGSLNRTRINHFVEKYNMRKDEDIKHLVSEEHLAQMERGQFDVIERFEDTEETEQAAEGNNETEIFENNIIEQFEDNKEEIYKLLDEGADLYHTTNQRAVPRNDNYGKENTFISDETIHKIVVNPTAKQQEYFDTPIYKATDIIDKVKERKLTNKIDLDNERHLDHLAGLVNSQYEIKDIKKVLANVS